MAAVLMFASAGQVAPPPPTTPIPPEESEVAVLLAPVTPAANSAAGYASAPSVAQGGSLDLHISSTLANYDISVRHADGNGWAPMTTITGLPGTYYDCDDVGAPAGQESAHLGCDWPVAYTLQVPSSWPSGIYAAQLLAHTTTPGGYGNYIMFVVTPSHPSTVAHILVDVPTNTWEAYNHFGGWSFYTSPISGTTSARRLTFDRPIAACLPDADCPGGASDDLVLVHWLESQGYVMDYAADQDIHNNPSLLPGYALVVVPGHSEYWTAEMRDALDTFISNGGNVAFFSGNTMYRQVRYQNNEHVVVCYKGDWQQDPFYGVDNHLLATEFSRSPWPNWPQNSTTGLGWTGYLNHYAGDPLTGKYTVYQADNWVFAGTGLHNEDVFWYEPTKDIEVDGTAFTMQNGQPVVTGQAGTPLSFTILGVQPSSRGDATMGVYTRPGGGTVFNAATTGWTRGLLPSENPQGYQTVQRITRNVMDRLGSYAVAEPYYEFLPLVVQQ